MKKSKAALVFIVDRSGSMCSIAKDMQGAITSVLSDQKEKFKGDIDVTFVRFDTEYEEVFSARSIQDISEDDLKINPRGGTALLDAMGQTLNTFERRFSETDKKDRPDKVLFLIITDGDENSSNEYSKERVMGMIKTLERDHEWGFTFIGANQDAIRAGSSIGVSRSKSLNYDASALGVQDMSRSVSNFTSSYLCDGDASYSDDE
jgi:Mg-chelatase subunit ChlD